jgi:4-amino-4-deoxy-L-arabinose transferase-like glycosyltransferase
MNLPGPRSAAWPVVLVAAALLLRLPGIDRLPPAIHQDEVSNGVDAWSLLTTGADRSGRAWPVFLEGFGAGDNRTALYAYLSIPAVAVLGPGVASTRIAAGLLGALTVLVTFLFVRRVRGPTVALLAAGLLAINPWHVYLSRYGHEASVTPTFLVLGLWLLARSADHRVVARSAPAGAPGTGRTQWVAAALGGAAMGLGLYSYPSYRLFLPCAIVLLLALRPVRLDRRALLGFAAGLGIVMAPLIVATAEHPERLLARARAASVFGNVEPFGAAVLLMARQYAEHFLPRFLWTSGDGNPLHSPPGGQLLWVEGLALIAGIVVAARRRDRWDRFLLVWLLLYPVASATSLGDRPEFVPHALRSAVGLPAFQILAGSGLVALLAGAGRRSRAAARGLAVALAVGALANFLVIAVSSATRWRTGVAPLYHAEYPPAMRTLAAQRPEFDLAVIACGENPQAYVYAILFGLQDPRAYQQSERDIVQTETFHLVRRAGPFFYVFDQADLERIRPLLHGRIRVVVPPGQMQAGHVMETIRGPRGEPAMEIRAIDIP